MQVESLPAPVTLPNNSPLLPTSAPVPLVTAETIDPPNVSIPPPAEEPEQPTFHVMQPPPPSSSSVPIAPLEPTVAPPSTATTFTQLVAVPMSTSDTPVASNGTVTTAPTVKPTKRVYISSCSKYIHNIVIF